MRDVGLLIKLTLLTALVSGLTALPALAAAEPPAEEPHVASELIVGYERQAPASTAETLNGVKPDPERLMEDTKLYQLRDGLSVAEAARRVAELPGVAYAEPNLIRSAAAPLPSDPYFIKQWALRNTGQLIGGVSGIAGADIGAAEAWEIQNGSPSTIVAVTDTGVDLSHPDLSGGALWINTGETPSNGIDDDSNGMIDDRRGWDFVSGDADPTDQNGHGTHVAGLIAARAFNGRGVVGVAPEASVMPIRVLDSTGSGTDADIARGFNYAARNGASVVNASLGGEGASSVIRDAVSDHPGVLFVFAAGNEGEDLSGRSYDPCTAPGQNVVCVAATDNRDRLAGFSNYSPSAVDLAAPGVSLISTYPEDRYTYMSGTSMATPVVSGAAAVLFSEDPSLTPAAARGLLLADAEPRAGLAGAVSSGARLDLAASLTDLTGEAPPPPALAPKTWITSHPRKRTRSHKAVFRFSSDQPGSTYQCRIDWRRWQRCYPATKLIRLGVGRHELSVRAEAAGLSDKTPARFSWRVKAGYRRWRG